MKYLIWTTLFAALAFSFSFRHSEELAAEREIEAPRVIRHSDVLVEKVIVPAKTPKMTAKTEAPVKSESVDECAKLGKNMAQQVEDPSDEKFQQAMQEAVSESPCGKDKPEVARLRETVAKNCAAAAESDDINDESRCLVASVELLAKVAP
jgi:hypothetical protein